MRKLSLKRREQEEKLQEMRAMRKLHLSMRTESDPCLQNKLRMKHQQSTGKDQNKRHSHENLPAGEKDHTQTRTDKRQTDRYTYTTQTHACTHTYAHTLIKCTVVNSGEIPYYLTLLPDDYCSSTPDDTSSESDSGMTDNVLAVVTDSKLSVKNMQKITRNEHYQVYQPQPSSPYSSL